MALTAELATVAQSVASKHFDICIGGHHATLVAAEFTG
jgi:hypothetical protein